MKQYDARISADMIIQIVDFHLSCKTRTAVDKRYLQILTRDSVTFGSVLEQMHDVYAIVRDLFPWLDL